MVLNIFLCVSVHSMVVWWKVRCKTVLTICTVPQDEIYQYSGTEILCDLEILNSKHIMDHSKLL